MTSLKVKLTMVNQKANQLPTNVHQVSTVFKFKTVCVHSIPPSLERAWPKQILGGGA